MSPFGVFVFSLALVRSNFAVGSAKQSEYAKLFRWGTTEVSSERDALPTASNSAANVDAMNVMDKQPQEHFRNVGGEAQSRPCCTSWAPGRIDCFIRGPKSSVLHMFLENGEYSDWEDLSGTIIDDIECISRDIGIIDVLVVGSDIALWVKTFSDGKWGSWESKGGKFSEVPSCVAKPVETIVCMARGIDNKGNYISSKAGKWTKVAQMGGMSMASPIGCVVRPSGYVNCFASGSDSSLKDAYTSSTTAWVGWVNFGNSVKGRPSVTSWSTTRLDVFTLSVHGNRVLLKTYDRGWQDWVDLGGVFDSAPECVTTGVGKIHCFAVGQKSYLYRNSFDGTTWSGWNKSFGFFLETPSCVVTNEDEIMCAVRRFNKEVVLLTYRF